MQKPKELTIILLSLLLLHLNCGSGEQENSSIGFVARNEKFNSYWNQGKAEITSYHLEQARYGEIHKGHSVLVFVTEPFSKSKQVKLDNASAAGNDAVNILKCNFTKKFNTGIYPYSMMMSAFTPIDTKEHPHSLKTTCTSQEWCGHTFTQFNLDDNKYNIELRSYFESEGDQNIELKTTWLEDELWNRIRINPKSLPVGEFDIIPGTFYQRLKHTKFVIQKCTAELTENDNQTIYSLVFNTSGRKLDITFNTKFPHEIEGWTETLQSGFGSSAKTLTTKATHNKRILSAYWNKNNVADSTLRKELGLP